MAVAEWEFLMNIGYTIRQDVATMSDAERTAYSAGMSRAFAAVFDVLSNPNVDAFHAIDERWRAALESQVVLGIVPAEMLI